MTIVQKCPSCASTDPGQRGGHEDCNGDPLVCTHPWHDELTRKCVEALLLSQSFFGRNAADKAAREVLDLARARGLVL